MRVGFARWRSALASGGNRYDEEFAARITTFGIDLREYEVVGGWPFPNEEERRTFGDTLASESHWLIGNIVASGAPVELANTVRSGSRVTMLLHYFPADDPSLTATDRARIHASEAEAVRAATTVVTTSEWAAAQVAARYGRADAVVAVPGTDSVELASGSEAAHPPRLLWLGRLTSTKDPLTFVNALARVAHLDWTAYLVGPEVDGVLANGLRERITRAGLESRVQLMGERQGLELEPIWAHSDLLVHTSRAETYGMVVSEALARGIPSIVAADTGAVEAQRGTDVMFPPGDDAALAGHLRRWLTSAQLRDDWRARAVAARSTLPTWEDTAQIVAAALRG